MVTTTLLILGASGDLTSRLLLPALGALLEREPDRNIALLGAGSDEWSAEKWRETVASRFAEAGATSAASRVGETSYTRADVTDAKSMRSLIAGIGGPLVIYFALPPAITKRCCEALKSIDLPDHTVLALEKPFGGDEESAKDLNRRLLDLVPEERVFRVDHFLGRSSLLNILGVRLTNRIFAPVWNAEHVESVEIRFDETLALEDRARYYDHAGALVDMIQSHLLQVLSLIALEPPAALDEVSLRSAKTAALRATHIWGDDPVTASRRGRYTAGSIAGSDVVSYVDEPGVDPSNRTETYADVVCEVRTERWAGVPFRLRSGKALGKNRSEITLRFRPVRHLAEGFGGSVPDGGRLTFTLGPDQLHLELNVTGGVDPFQIHRDTLASRLGDGQLRAYSEVLSEILDGNVTLSVRADSAEECWRILQPVRDAWARDHVEMHEYAAGSEGPEPLSVPGLLTKSRSAAPERHPAIPPVAR
ncbi:glucose-6-phosphate dehydrogenase [Leucobacter sp. USHLN153]|uniref:glucose-6-phosphate dehydrogenase n=1 Tax=Leucobacter sp. USHLN153 TaxID=3081268 RepID=UPI003015F017